MLQVFKTEIIDQRITVSASIKAVTLANSVDSTHPEANAKYGNLEYDKCFE